MQPHQRRRLRALALFAFLLAITEFCGQFIPAPPATEFNDQKDLLASSPAHEIQILGDSAAFHAIDPDLLRDSDEGGCINLAAHGSGPVFAYYFLQAQVRNKRPLPRTILYAQSPHTFAGQRTAKFIAAYAGFGETLDFLVSSGDVTEVAYGLACKTSHFLRYRDEWAQIARGDIGHLRRFSGAEALRPGSHDDRKPDLRPEKLPRSTYGKAFSATELNTRYVTRLIALAEAHDIEFIWAVPPVLEVVAESRRPYNFDESYWQYRQDRAAEFPKTRILHRNFVILPDSHFFDFTHTNDIGRKAYTATLSKELAKVRE